MRKIIIYNSEEKRWEPMNGQFSAKDQRLWVERIFSAGGFAFTCPPDHVDLYTGKRARSVEVVSE